jgi:3-methyladenine DNA glycosylase AlkD
MNRKASPHREPTTTSAAAVSAALADMADPQVANHARRFFKSGPGEYGEEDQFLGVRVPVIRTLLKTCHKMPLSAVKPLFTSRWHEERLFAVLLCNEWCKGADPKTHQRIYNFYMRHRRWVNNWDLVDGSAPWVVDGWVYQTSTVPLFELCELASVWDRRIAMLATLTAIRQGKTVDAVALVTRDLDDRHDLIHKVSGWMLREMGKREIETLRLFLREHAATMPRTMLRYSIEKLSKDERQHWMTRTAH